MENYKNTDKSIRIKKELYNIDKNIHDTYIGIFVCKCTHDTLCREFINCMSPYEINKYMNLDHLSQEQKDWVIQSLLIEQNKDI